jgi:hypothetical protein
MISIDLIQLKRTNTGWHIIIYCSNEMYPDRWYRMTYFFTEGGIWLQKIEHWRGEKEQLETAVPVFMTLCRFKWYLMQTKSAGEVPGKIYRNKTGERTPRKDGRQHQKRSRCLWDYLSWRKLDWCRKRSWLQPKTILFKDLVLEVRVFQWRCMIDCLHGSKGQRCFNSRDCMGLNG